MDDRFKGGLCTLRTREPKSVGTLEKTVRFVSCHLRSGCPVQVRFVYWRDHLWPLGSPMLPVRHRPSSRWAIEQLSGSRPYS